MSDIYEISVYSSDARTADDNANGNSGRREFMAEGSHYIYWRDPETHQRRAVYNISPEQVDEVRHRIRTDPSAPYEALVGHISNAAYGDEHAKVRFVPPAE